MTKKGQNPQAISSLQTTHTESDEKREISYYSVDFKEAALFWKFWVVWAALPRDEDWHLEDFTHSAPLLLLLLLNWFLTWLCSASNFLASLALETKTYWWWFVLTSGLAHRRSELLRTCAYLNTILGEFFVRYYDYYYYDSPLCVTPTE